MATTQYFEGPLRDAQRPNAEIEIEFGTSTFYDGEALIYLNVEGASIIMSEEQGRALCEAFANVAHYLGYRRL